MAARVTKFDFEVLIDPNASPAVPETNYIDIVPITSLEEIGYDLEFVYGQFIEGDSITSNENFGTELDIYSETFINEVNVSSVESFGSENNLLRFIDSGSVESAEDLTLESLYAEYAFEQNSIESSEEFSPLFIDLLLDPLAIDSTENFGTESYLYPESYIDPNSLTSEEILVLDRAHAEAYIYPSEISSAEVFRKQVVFPKPFPGYIYNWYEKLQSIETELNSRVK